MKKILFAISISFLSLFTTPTILYAQQNNTIQPIADIKIWKYKAIKGRLHKRLWNKTQNKWETEWIPV